MYADGHTIKEIIDFLNNKNIKTSTGTKFNYSSLHTMLKNKKYIGTYTYGNYEIENGIPRIISNELFEKVQRATETNKKAPARTIPQNNFYKCEIPQKALDKYPSD